MLSICFLQVFCYIWGDTKLKIDSSCFYVDRWGKKYHQSEQLWLKEKIIIALLKLNKIHIAAHACELRLHTGNSSVSWIWRVNEKRFINWWRIFQEGKAAWAMVQAWVKVPCIQRRASSSEWLEQRAMSLEREERIV